MDMRYFFKRKNFSKAKTIGNRAFSKIKSGILSFKNGLIKRYPAILLILVSVIIIIELYFCDAFIITTKRFDNSEGYYKMIAEIGENPLLKDLDFVPDLEKIQFAKDEEELLEELTIPEPYTKHDLELLTTMVYCENGGVEGKIEINGEEGDACTLHRWTAQVCLNHLKNENINVNSIYEALYYPRYPSYYRESETAQRCREENYERWLDCEQDCLMAMNGLVDLPENVIYASNFADLGSGYFAKIHVKTDYVDTWCYFAYE